MQCQRGTSLGLLTSVQMMVCCAYLKLCLTTLGTLAEDGNDEGNAVNDGRVPGCLQVPLLGARKHRVHKDPAANLSTGEISAAPCWSDLRVKLAPVALLTRLIKEQLTPWISVAPGVSGKTLSEFIAKDDFPLR